MARCHLCKKYLGLGVFSKWVTMDRRHFCPSCSARYAEQRRLLVLKDILDEPRANPIFTIDRMRTENPDRANRREILVGATAFLDKGICFIQLGSYTKSNAGWGLIFGILVTVLADAADKRKMVKEFDRIRDETPVTDDALFDRMLGAEHVLFYPLRDIKKLTKDRGGINIHFDKYRKRFVWDGGGKTHRYYRQLLESYILAVRTQSDPLELCCDVS